MGFMLKIFLLACVFSLLEWVDRKYFNSLIAKGVMGKTLPPRSYEDYEPEDEKVEVTNYFNGEIVTGLNFVQSKEHAVADGDTWFNTDTEKLHIYHGGKWVECSLAPQQKPAILQNVFMRCDGCGANNHIQKNGKFICEFCGSDSQVKTVDKETKKAQVKKVVIPPTAPEDRAEF